MPRRSRGDDGRGDLAECPEPEGSNARKVAGQIGTPRPPDPIMRRPRADREEKRVTHGNGKRREEQLDPHNPNQRRHLGAIPREMAPLFHLAFPAFRSDSPPAARSPTPSDTRMVDQQGEASLAGAGNQTPLAWEAGSIELAFKRPARRSARRFEGRFRSHPTIKWRSNRIIRAADLRQYRAVTRPETHRYRGDGHDQMGTKTARPPHETPDGRPWINQSRRCSLPML